MTPGCPVLRVWLWFDVPLFIATSCACLLVACVNPVAVSCLEKTIIPTLAWCLAVFPTLFCAALFHKVLFRLSLLNLSTLNPTALSICPFQTLQAQVVITRRSGRRTWTLQSLMGSPHPPPPSPTRGGQAAWAPRGLSPRHACTA